jgi:hypothetical protein
MADRSLPDSREDPPSPIAASAIVRAIDPVRIEVPVPTGVQGKSRPAADRTQPPAVGYRAPIDPRPARSDASRPAETAVHVTIGRIEIRAVREATRPGPQPARPPGMSLEEYLRRRSAGSS